MCFSADYAFAQDVMDEVETIVDRVGPLSFVKNILLFYLEDHGIHDGVVWECVVNLSESAHESPSYRKHMDALLAEYGEDRYPKVRQDSANLQACLTRPGAFSPDCRWRRRRWSCPTRFVG